MNNNKKIIWALKGVLCFLILGIQSLIGCCSIPCTRIGCGPSLSILIEVNEGILKKGVYEFEMLFDSNRIYCQIITNEKGQSEQKNCPLNNGPVSISQSAAYFEDKPYIKEFRISFEEKEYPRSIKITLSKNTKPWFTIVQVPSYEPSRPNGTLCPPECLGAGFYQYILPNPPE